ncbi:PREDICTED: granzyme A-like [Nanorana parkeri]|uniref:granzyme A-like n=1 Tax=Nanorana parkeri TaxID=125878 RepID=UPI0008550029|nr:PREDICTED: granzyme A-like [Nanorana parkeri]
MNAICHLLIVAVTLQTGNGVSLKIVGGKEAGLRPYMALVRTPGKTFCGGTLIKPGWVLTAAECRVDRTTTVDLGVRSIKATREKQRQQFTVIKSITHQKYNTKKHINNLQLLQLSGTANLTKDVNVVRFPETFPEVKPGSVCGIAGWGKTNNKNSYNSDKLMEARVTVIDRKKCVNQWKPTVQITKDMVCTSGKEASMGFCNGDGGGPLLCGGFLKGIMSFGSLLCGIPNGADVSTRLTKDYMKWINKETKKRP